MQFAKNMSYAKDILISAEKSTTFQMTEVWHHLSLQNPLPWSVHWTMNSQAEQRGTVLSDR